MDQKPFKVGDKVMYFSGSTSDMSREKVYAIHKTGRFTLKAGGQQYRQEGGGATGEGWSKSHVEHETPALLERLRRKNLIQDFKGKLAVLRSRAHTLHPDVLENTDAHITKVLKDLGTEGM